MKRCIVYLVLLGLLLVMAGCASPWIAPVVPPQGIAFSSTKAPIDIDCNNSDLGSKMGQSSTVCVLILFAFGDASIASAAQKGNIQIVKHADYSYLNVLGLFQSFTTIVYGD